MCAPPFGFISQRYSFYTLGNANEIDRKSRMVSVNPFGVDYSNMSTDDMMVVGISTGKKVEDQLKHSSNTSTHL